MPYINVHVSEALNQAILDAAQEGGKDWSRAKWLRKMAQQALAKDAVSAVVKIIKGRRANAAKKPGKARA